MVKITVTILAIHVAMVATMGLIILLHCLHFNERVDEMRNLSVVFFILLMSALVAIVTSFVIEFILL